MLDLFSGIGGFSLAAQWCWGDELEIVAFCEIDKFCQKVLQKHWLNVPIIEDVRDVQHTTIERLSNRTSNTMEEQKEKSQPKRPDSLSIDLLTGGFPCQPFSCAGKRKGKEDNRFLWPEMLRVIKETRPRWIVAENVAGIVRMALDDCLSDLESEGYSAGTVIIPACAVNAPHRRDRVWLVAYTESTGEITTQQPRQRNSIEQCSQDVADPEQFNRYRKSSSTEKIESIRGTKPSISQCDWWSTEPDVGRTFNGLPMGLDGNLWTDGWENKIPRVAKGIPERVNRLKSLGNAIVPHVAYQIFKAIKEIERRG